MEGFRQLRILIQTLLKFLGHIELRHGLLLHPGAGLRHLVADPGTACDWLAVQNPGPGKHQRGAAESRDRLAGRPHLADQPLDVPGLGTVAGKFPGGDEGADDQAVVVGGAGAV